MRIIFLGLFLLSFDLLASNYASWETYIAKDSKIEYFSTKNLSYKLALDVIMNEDFLVIRTKPSKKCKSSYGVQQGVFRINNKDIKIDVSCNSYGWLTHEISTEKGRKYIYDVLLNATKVEFSFDAPDYKLAVETQTFVKPSGSSGLSQYHAGKRNLSLYNQLQTIVKPIPYLIQKDSRWYSKKQSEVFSSFDRRDNQNTSFTYNHILDKLEMNLRFGSGDSRSCKAFKHKNTAKLYINKTLINIKTKCEASLFTTVDNIDLYRLKGTLTAMNLSEKQLETIKTIILDSKIIDIELDVNDDGRGDMRQVLVFSEPLSNVINKKLIKEAAINKDLESRTNNAL